MKSVRIFIVIALLLMTSSCQSVSQIEATQEPTAEQTTAPTPEPTAAPTATPKPKPAPDAEILCSSERGGDRDLYMMDADGGNLRCILDLPSIEGHGDFAPDGNRIAFFSTMDGNREIYVIDISQDEITPVRLTNSEGDDHLPDWSPDGGQIVFESSRDGNSEIYIMDADGKNQRRLTENTLSDKQPKFSPDGTLICYTTNISGTEYMATISVEDILNSSEIPESQVLDVKNVGYVDFAPDGNSIAYHGTVNGHTSLYMMDNETHETSEILKSSSYSLWIPVFSQDGKWIAFNKEKGYGSGDVYIRSLEDNTEYQLTFDSSSDWGPDWRPIANYKILFDSNRERDREIYLYQTIDKSLTKLTDNEDEDGIPYWSPDGTQIVFFSDRDGDDEIYIMDADGSNVVQLTDNDTEDRAAAWSHDGTFIVYSSTREGFKQIYIMNADGSNQKPLTYNNEKDFWPEISPDDKTVTYTNFTDTQATYTIDITNWRNRTEFRPELLRKNCSRCQYSPDGTKLAYSTQINGHWQIAICDADGTNEQVLTTSSFNKWVPTWMNDTHLLYSKESGMSASIVLIDIETGAEATLQNASSQNWRPISFTD